MRSSLTHTLAMDREEVFAYSPHGTIAVVDLETYPPFVGKDADSLDLMVHLYGQMQALTAISWDVTAAKLNLRLILTEDDQAVERMARFQCGTTISGWVRTNGQLCLIDHDRLVACAHDHALDLLHPAKKAKISLPTLLNVPPGTYSILILHHIPQEDASPPTTMDYTVILRHYPFPAPRIAPVRLPGGFFGRTEDDTVRADPKNVITSHARIW